MSYSPIITVAAFNSLLRANESVDFVCTGKNDELVLNKAIQYIAAQNNSTFKPEMIVFRCGNGK